MLPNIPITENLQIEIDKAYLDFLTSLFISSRKDDEQFYKSKEKQLWFIEELAIYLKCAYPKLTKQDRLNILHQIIGMSEPTAVKQAKEQE